MDLIGDFWLLVSELSFHAFEAAKCFGNFLIKTKIKDDRAEHFLHHRHSPIPYQCQFCAYDLESKSVNHQPEGYDETDSIV